MSDLNVSGRASSARVPPAVAALRHGVLYEQHRALGAVFTSFAGWEMPLRYGSDTDEHRAVRGAAGLFDLSHMGEIIVRGADAGTALDAALVGDLSSLAVGRARYTMMCAADGGVLDDLVVFRTDGDSYLVVANASNTGTVCAQLRERAPIGDVDVADETDLWSLIGLQGPRAAAILAPVVSAPVDELQYYASTPVEVDGIPSLLARTGYTGEDGFEIFVRDGAVDLWRMLLERGAAADVTPAGLAARDSLRLEAGMPLYGNELTVDRTPFEAGLDRLVRFEKPCDFVGRAALLRRRDAGASRRLVGLAGRGRRAARTGNTVIARGAVAGADVGVVTSGMLSPTLGHPIAMAYVDSAQSTPGTELVVDVRGRNEDVHVVKLPFYRRPRK